jgi:hypothetical protein
LAIFAALVCNRELFFFRTRERWANDGNAFDTAVVTSAVIAAGDVLVAMIVIYFVEIAGFWRR